MASFESPRSFSVSLILGYVLLFLGIVGLDQTSKWHSESLYLKSSSATSLSDYRSSAKRVMTWGVSPAVVEEKSLEATQVSANWLDFNITYLRNEGAVWGIFADLPDVFRLSLFYSVTLIAVAGVLYFFRQGHPGNRMYHTALVLILGGAIGNFIDRLLLQYVIDWIHFHWKIFGWEYSFPVFNVADIAIDVGIVLMLLDSLLSDAAVRKSARNAAVDQQSSKDFVPS